jgi:chemotaxis protein MotB
LDANHDGAIELRELEAFMIRRITGGSAPETSVDPSQVDDLTRRCGELEQALQEACDRCATLEAQLSDSAEEPPAPENQGEMAAVQQLESELKKGKDAFNKLKAKAKQFRDKLTASEQQCDDLRVALDKAEQTASVVSQQRDDASKELTETRALLLRLEEALAQTKEDTARQAQESRGIREGADALQKAEASRAQIEARLQETTAALEDCQRAYKEARSSAAASEEATAAREEELQATREESQRDTEAQTDSLKSQAVQNALQLTNLQRALEEVVDAKEREAGVAQARIAELCLTVEAKEEALEEALKALRAAELQQQAAEDALTKAEEAGLAVQTGLVEAEARVEELTTNKELLEAQLDDEREARSQAATASAAELSDKLAAQARELAAQAEELAAALERISGLEAQLSDAQEAAKTAEKLAEARLAELSTAHVAFERLQGKAKQQKAALQKTRKELAAAQEEAKVQGEGGRGLQGQLEHLEQELARAQTQLGDRDTELTSALEKAAACAEITLELKGAQRQVEELTKSLRLAEQGTSATQSELEALQKQLEDEAAEYEELISSMKADHNAELQAQEERVAAAGMDQQQQLQLEQQLTTQKAESDRLEVEVVRLTAEVSRLIERLEQAEAAQQTAEAKAETSALALTAASTESNELLATLRTAVAERDDEVRTLREQAEQSLRVLDSMRGELERVAGELKTAETQRDVFASLKDERQQLEAELATVKADASAAAATAEERIRSLEGMVETASAAARGADETELQRLRLALDEAQAMSEAQAETIAEYENVIESLRARIDKMERDGAASVAAATAMATATRSSGVRRNA